MTFVPKLPTDEDQRRPRRRRLRSLAFAPTLVTLGNLLCGFAAVHFGMRAMLELGTGAVGEQVAALPSSALERLLPSFLSVGAGLVILGMILDLFDGLIARVTRSTTNFGGQLDSLADVVTFGVAPATLMVAFMTRELAGDSIIPSPISDHLLGRATWVAAAIYVAFTAIRLARFNVEHAKDDFDHRSFRGLPSPGAAAILVALLLFQDQDTFASASKIFVYITPVIATVIAFLMVSRVPYRRLHRAYLLGRQPFGQFVVIVLVLAVFWSYKTPTLLVLTLWYGASGPVFLMLKRIRDGRRPAVVGPAPIVDETHRRSG